MKSFFLSSIRKGYVRPDDTFSGDTVPAHRRLGRSAPGQNVAAADGHFRSISARQRPGVRMDCVNA